MSDLDPDSMSDEEWRRYVTARLRKGDDRFDTLEVQGAEMRTAIAANTQLTAEIKKDVSDLRTSVNPVLEAMKTMEAGIKTIGRIGDGSAKLFRLVIYAAACWAALKLLLLGSSWADVAQAFRDAVGK